jgi:hypothetical protein
MDGTALESRKELHLGASTTIRVIGFLLFGAVGQALAAQQPTPSTALKSYDLKEPGGQILSYGYQAGATDVRLQGTHRAPNARIRLKIGSRPGFVELDINRGLISGLEPAQVFGKDFLTYVLWAVSVDGRAANLGEITFDGPNPVSINVTTPYQTFWLMVTAEPDYAVADPSPVVVLYSVGQSGTDATPEKRALRIDGGLSYYTHYSSYDTSKGKPETAPNELLQARKALELASKASQTLTKEEERVSKALTMARTFLNLAETAYKKDPKGTDVIQFARTAAQIAENGRALALGAVGDVAVRRLENELHALHSELKGREAGNASSLRTPVAGIVSASPAVGVVPTVAMSTPNSSLVEEGKQAGGITETMKKLAAQPITWFGVIGWAIVVLLLFRRPAV